MTIQVGQIISGYQNELGVTLNKISEVGEETSSVEVTLYEPDHEDFAWALSQLQALTDAE